MENHLSIQQIREALQLLQRRIACGDDVPSLSEIAKLSGVSRQTLYNVLQGQRAEFGEVAQIRLSMCLKSLTGRLMASKTNLMNVRLTAAGPSLRFGPGLSNLGR